MHLKDNIWQKQVISLSNYLGNTEPNNIKKADLSQEYSEALTHKCSFSFFQGGCDSVFQTYFTMEIFICICVFAFIYLFFGGAFQGSTDMNPDMEDGTYQYLENSRWDILAVAQRTYIWVVLEDNMEKVYSRQDFKEF